MYLYMLSCGQGRGFFKGMSFPVATIAAYNSLVFGFFSNAQRAICKRRYGDERHHASLNDVAAASMLTGLVSVALGAPIDLVKIRLQMQSHTAVLAGRSRMCTHKCKFTAATSRLQPCCQG